MKNLIKTMLLNKSLRNIGTEFDLNIKKSPLQSNTQSYIVGYRKINDTQFDEAMKLLIDIIYQFEYDYDKIQKKLKIESNENKYKDDIFNLYMKEIIKTEEQMKKVLNAEIELNKNNFLNFIQKSKAYKTFVKETVDDLKNQKEKRDHPVTTTSEEYEIKETKPDKTSKCFTFSIHISFSFIFFYFFACIFI